MAQLLACRLMRPAWVHDGRGTQCAHGTQAFSKSVHPQCVSASPHVSSLHKPAVALPRAMLGRQRPLTQSPHQCRGPGCGVCAIQVIRACRASRMCSRVCGIGPSVADTTRIAPSICPRPAQSARARLSAQRLVSTALGWYKGALRAVCAPGSNMHAPGHPAPGAAAAPGKDRLCRGGTWSGSCAHCSSTDCCTACASQAGSGRSSPVCGCV